MRSKIDFCPPALDALIYQLMQKAPEDRPRSAETVRQELARIRREMREGETMIGVTAPTAPVKETVRIPGPEADTPSELPFPEPSPQPPPADPTARFQAVGPRERSGSKVWIGIGLLAAALAIGAFFLFQGNTPSDSIVEPPPLTIREPVPGPPEPIKVTPPEPVPVPVKANPPPVKPNPPPVKPNTPRPPPKAGAVAGSPTFEELTVELNKVLDRMERTKAASPSMLKQFEGLWRKRIKEATSQKERAALLTELGQVP